MENEILDGLRPTFRSMAATIGNFPHDVFNTIPEEGSWTPGQVAQHVLLSVKNMPKLLQADGADPNRDPQHHIAAIKGIFLDFSTQMKSPEFIEPVPKSYDRDALADFFGDFADTIAQLAQNLDLSQLCLDFELPNMGKLTRLEWLAFIQFHTQRHEHQLQQMLKNLRAA